MKINICGTVEGESGYANHTRELGLALKRIGIDTAFETQMTNPNWQRAVSNELREMILKDHRFEGIQLMITPPPMAYLKSGDRTLIICYAVFEGTKIPTSWRLALNEKFINHVIVPSTHTLGACMTAGVQTPISIVPHGYDPKVFNTEGRAEIDEFAFVWCKGWSQGDKDRSNLVLFLKAFAEEFKNDAKVKAIVKINPSYAQIDFPAAIRALNIEGLKDKLFLNAQIIPSTELAKVYKSGNVFVSTSRAEGFNLPCLEAMACGMPVIAPAFGGQADFIKDGENGWLLQKGKSIVPGDSNPIYEECRWWDSDQKELQERMRYAFDNRDETRKRGIQASNDAGSYTWEDSARAIEKICKEL